MIKQQMDFYNVVCVGIILSFLIWCREPDPIPEIENIAVKEEVKFSPVLLVPDIEPKKNNYIEVEMKITAYCPCKICCEGYADGKTVTGKNAYSRGIAVDPKVISLGTTIEVPGYGKYEADDIGGAIKGNKIDVRFEKHEEAVRWGVKKLKVKVWK